MRTERRNNEYGGTQIFDEINDAKWDAVPFLDGYGQYRANCWWEIYDPEESLWIEEQERLWNLDSPIV